MKLLNAATNKDKSRNLCTITFFCGRSWCFRSSWAWTINVASSPIFVLLLNYALKFQNSAENLYWRRDTKITRLSCWKHKLYMATTALQHVICIIAFLAVGNGAILICKLSRSAFLIVKNAYLHEEHPTPSCSQNQSLHPPTKWSYFHKLFCCSFMQKFQIPTLYLADFF